MYGYFTYSYFTVRSFDVCVQGSFYSNAVKSLITLSTVILLGLVIAYHGLQAQVGRLTITDLGYFLSPVYTIQPVLNTVVKPVVQPIDNRLYRVNEVLATAHYF